MPYPSAPWNMHGDLWLSLFRVRPGDHPDREPGVYGVALVAYEEPSPLTYSELLVARPAKGARGFGVEITDIWVDSPDSRDGGRELWAIPKHLCDFSRELRTAGPSCRATWSAYDASTGFVRARFADLSAAAPRLPFKGATRQPREQETVTAELSGSGRTLPCRAHWEFAPEGPLGWLAGKHALASFRMASFAMSFG